MVIQKRLFFLCLHRILILYRIWFPCFAGPSLFSLTVTEVTVLPIRSKWAKSENLCFTSTKARFHPTNRIPRIQHAFSSTSWKCTLWTQRTCVTSSTRCQRSIAEPRSSSKNYFIYIYIAFHFLILRPSIIQFQNGSLNLSFTVCVFDRSRSRNRS